ncbi:MAG TPA: GNAT family N-acetyltransferase [Candidatus Limnocylindria bacterium]|nr:GNAT family N-acetyltransferase [Candidatus Limnocylindria bacterium]
MTLTTGPDAGCTPRAPAELSGAWSAIAEQRSPASIFLTPEWIEVARAHDDADAITLAVGDPARGIAALAREADGTLRFAGGELTDEQDVIAPAGQERDVAVAVASWIASDAPRKVRLEYVPEDRPTLDVMAATLGARGYRVERSRLVTSPLVRLPADFATYVQSLGKKERHELRRKIRRLESATQATFRWSADAERAAVLDRFFALHRLSRGGKADFMTPDVERFFRDVADALEPLGRLRLGVLRAHGEDAAVLFAFAYRGTLALYNAAYDPALASLSIGIVGHAWAVREAIAERFHTYDLLRGDEPYKYDLGATDRWLGRLEAVRG